ncbi:MAG: DNA polymerase Y family protein [Proteobacteria bacterium]|nr:DNA polymerase Y family protein [Pseudomonadota bacterium]
MGIAGPRYLVVHLPAFRLERCGYNADEVVALVDERRNATRLIALTPKAWQEGLRLEMTASQARALIPHVILEPLDAAGEQEDRNALVRSFLSFSDKVSALFADSLVLEIHHTVHLFGGEAPMGRQAQELAHSLGHRARVAMANDPLAALALAEWRSQSTILPHAATTSKLAALPIVALRPSPPLQQALLALGITKIGELARLDAASVAGRFGEEGARLLRIARGQRSSRHSLVANIDETPRAGVAFGDSVCNLDTIHAVLPGLLAQLAGQLSARSEVASQIALRLDCESPPTRVMRIRPGRPTRQADVLEGLFRARLERLRVSSPVVELHLEVEECTPEPGWQPGLTNRAESREPLPDLVKRLMDKMGDHSVFHGALANKWRPEDSWKAVHYNPRLITSRRKAKPGDDPVDRQESLEHNLPRTRPLLVLPVPQPTRVRVDHYQRPEAILLNTGWVRIKHSNGPERLQGEWWKSNGFNRDYWAIEVFHGTAWVFHENRRWFLHGWFD